MAANQPQLAAVERPVKVGDLFRFKVCDLPSRRTVCASRWKRAKACSSFEISSGRNFRADKAVQLHVLGLIDHTHSPVAELIDNAVVRDGLADHWAES